MKLYGEELDREMGKRAQAKEERLAQRITIRKAAATNGMGLSPSEYCNWENGSDICPHEEYEKSISGFHYPFLILNICKKCGHSEIVSKIEDSSQMEEYKDIVKEALTNDRSVQLAGRIARS